MITNSKLLDVISNKEPEPLPTTKAIISIDNAYTKQLYF
jgi:hypothetical protein